MPRILAFAALLILAACAAPEGPKPRAIGAVPSPRADAARMQRPAPSAPLKRTEVVKVGLLLPLSGEHAQLGGALLDAAMLALADKQDSRALTDRDAPQVTLIPKDTRGSAQGAQEALELARRDGVTLILGPVFAHEAKAVAGAARQANLNVIAFSNNPTVAQPGVYILGFSPEQQVSRVVRFARRQGLSAFGLLAPSNAYGAITARALKDAAAQNGSTFAVSATYSTTGADAQLAAQRVAQTPLHALMIPEGGAALAQVVAQTQGVLPYGRLQLLGTGLWDDPATSRIAAAHGGWFASSPPQLNRAFELRFQQFYGYQPARLASLAYDAAALAATLASAPGPRPFGTSAITDPRGYFGPANGLFRFRADGSNERGLAVLRVGPGGFEVVDPAPQAFAE